MTQLLFALVLFAQPAQSAPGGGELADSGGVTGGGISLTLMISESQEALLGMSAGLRRASDILREARQSTDIVRMNCVNEKLTVIKGIIRIAEDAAQGLTEAVSRRNEDQAAYEHNKVKISLDRVNSLVVQAVNCIGSSATQSGETKVGVDLARSLRNKNVLATSDPMGDARTWGDDMVDGTQTDGLDEGTSNGEDAGDSVAGDGIGSGGAPGDVAPGGGGASEPPDVHLPNASRAN
jgi:hypothetical protein